MYILLVADGTMIDSCLNSWLNIYNIYDSNTAVQGLIKAACLDGTSRNPHAYRVLLLGMWDILAFAKLFWWLSFSSAEL